MCQGRTDASLSRVPGRNFIPVPVRQPERDMNQGHDRVPGTNCNGDGAACVSTHMPDTPRET